MVDTAVAIQCWQSDIDRYLGSFPAVGRVFKGASSNAPIDFCVWLWVPAEGAPHAEWGIAFKQILESNGIKVITSNDVARCTGDHLKGVDLVAMFAFTSDIAVECVHRAKELGSRVLIFYPAEHVRDRAFAILSEDYGLNPITIDLTELEKGHHTRIGFDLFQSAADRFLEKTTINEKILRLKNTVVVMVHGIRTRAEWQSSIKRALSRRGVVVEATNYGRMTTLRFLMPGSRFREPEIERVHRHINAIRENYRGAKISVLAHSFGTFIIGEIFKRDPSFAVEGLVFCGSILRSDFPFDGIRSKFSKIVNEIGCKDPWPVVAEIVTRRYGATGTFGFNATFVDDRHHNGMGHGGFLTEDFCSRFWNPFFEDGKIVPGDMTKSSTPWWIRALSSTTTRWIALILAIGLSALFVFETL